MMPVEYHFIIVEDEGDFRLLLRRMLSRCCACAKIFEATTGQEACKIYASHGASLMIIEHHLPHLDGLSLVRFLRSQNVTIPLILTSDNPQIDRISAAAGATCFVEKSRLFDSLETLLPQLLEQKAARV